MCGSLFGGSEAPAPPPPPAPPPKQPTYASDAVSNAKESAIKDQQRISMAGRAGTILTRNSDLSSKDDEDVNTRQSTILGRTA